MPGPPPDEAVGRPFTWYSLTKLITATATLRLVERGALSLEDPLARWLPEAHPPLEVTVRHLLEHRVGLPNPPPAGLDRSSLPVPEREGGILPRARPPVATRAWRRLPPRQGFRDRMGRAGAAVRGWADGRAPGIGGRGAYSNLSYVVAGEVLERAAGRDLRE